MAATTSSAPCQDIARLVDQLRQGKSLFSTKLGKWAPRIAESPLSPIIIRTDPVEDMHSMVASLRGEFPKECKEICGPIRNIYDYFDHQDVHMHGLNFIQSVLNQIARENEERVRNIEDFAQRWMEMNVARFCSVDANTQEIFDETEKKHRHERFLHDALELLKVYRTNPPTLTQGFSEPRRSFSLALTFPVAPHLPIVEYRPSDYRSMVTASRVPSGPKFAQNLFTEPDYNRSTVGQRRNSARSSLSEGRPPIVPVAPYHGEWKPIAGNRPDISAQALGEIEGSIQQVIPVEPLRIAEAPDKGHVYSHQLLPMTSNAGSLSGITAAYTVGQSTPNPMRSDNYRPRGKSGTYNGKRSAGQPFGSGWNNNRMSSPQLAPYPHNAPDVPHVNSTGDHGIPVQVPLGLQGGMTPFPAYGLDYLPEMPVQPQATQTSSAPLQRGYPQRPPSFGQTGNTHTPIENQYEGYHYGNIELQGRGNISQTKGRTSSRTGSNQTHSQQPFTYAGNNKTHGRPQGNSGPRQNPRKSFSDDARNLLAQGTMGPREFSGDNNRSRHSSSGSIYDAQDPSQPGWQRGHHRQYGPYRGGSRRPSFSQQVPTDRNGVPIEGGFSHMGYFGGGGGSGDFSHLAHQTIQEDRSDGGQRASFNEEAVRTEDDANTGNTLPRQSKHTAAGDLPAHAQGEKPNNAYPPEDIALHHDRGTTNVNTPTYSANAMGFVPNLHQQPFRASGDLAGMRTFTHTQRNPHLVDPCKVFVLGDGLTKQEVERIFEPYGTIVGLVGPKGQTHTQPMAKPWFWVTYSTRAEAARAIHDLQSFQLSTGDRLLVRPGYVSQWEPSTNQSPSAIEVSNQTHRNAAGNAQTDFHGPPSTQEPTPVHHSFRPNQNNAYGEGFGRGRRYSERRQDADGVAEFARRPKDTRSPPKTPKKNNRKGGKGKSKVSTPTHRGESESEPAQPQKEETGDPAKYDGRRQSANAASVPYGRKSGSMTPVRTEQHKLVKEPRQDRQTNKETKWKRDISERRPVSLADIVPKIRESPKRGESRADKTPQLISDGSPSRKSRPALRKSHTSDLILVPQTPNSSQEKKGNLGGLTADEWPVLRKVENANVGHQERTAYSTVVIRNMLPEIIDRSSTQALKEEAATATVPEPLNEAQQETSPGHERPHTPMDDRIAERTETVTMPLLSPMKETAAITQISAAEKDTANSQIPPGVEEPSSKTAATVQRSLSPCISPKMADFPDVTDAPWDPRNLPNDSKKSDSHVGTPEQQELHDDNPRGRTSPDVARHASSISGPTATHVTSDTQTERSESWAELSERNEPSSFSKARNWCGDLSSATSMADPESRRSSSFTGLSKAIGERKKDPSPPMDVAMAEPIGTLASASSSAGKSNQCPNANRLRPCRRSVQLNSFDCWRADIEARESDVGVHQDSKVETATLMNLLKHAASSVKDVPSAAGPSSSAETSDKVRTGFESLKGKGKELTIEIPPRTPSPSVTDTALVSHSKSPKCGKKKEPLEPLLRSASHSVPVGPIATHKKKKSKPSTPTKLISKRKDTVSKHKENKVQEPQIPGETQTTELNDVTSCTEPEIRVTLEEGEVKVASDDGHPPDTAGLLARTPTPYASASYKDIVQDEVALPCSTKKDRDGLNKVSPELVPGFEEQILKLIQQRTSQNPNTSSAGSQSAFFKKGGTSEHTSPDSKDTDSTFEDRKDSETVPETSQEKSAGAQRSKNRNKNRRAKGKGKEKARSRHSSTSDITVALPRPAEFPTLPLDSPIPSLVEGVDEQEVFPPLEVVVQDSEDRSIFTEEWLQFVESNRAAHSEDSPPRDVEEEMRIFDRGRSEYQISKSPYEIEKTRKFERLEGLANRGGLGIDLGLAPKDGDELGGSFGHQMPPTPVTPGPEAISLEEFLRKRGAASEASGKSEPVDIGGNSMLNPVTLNKSGIPRSLIMTTSKTRPPAKLEEQARPESPPLGGPSTPPPLSTEEAATIARLTAKKADCVLELLRKDHVGPDVPPSPELPTDGANAGSSPKKATPTSSECSTEIDLALEELSVQVTKPSEGGSPAPPNAEGVPTSTPVTIIKTGSSPVNTPASMPEAEPSAKSESSIDVRSSGEPETSQQLSSDLTVNLAQENITALNSNGEIILIFPKDSRDKAGTSSHESPDKPTSPPADPLTPSTDSTKTAAPTPSSAEAMPPPPPPASSVTESDFPSLPTAKAPSSETDSPSNRKLTLPHRRSSARSRLSEANIAALESTATPPPQQGRRRGESAKSMSEFSTTSSVRRKLFSEAAASPGVSARHPEGAVGGGQSHQSFVGAPAFFHPSSPASRSPPNSITAHALESPTSPLPPSGTFVLSGSAPSTVVATLDEALPSSRTLTAVPTLSPFPDAGSSSSSATLPLPPPSTFIAGRRRGAKRRRLPDFWTGN